MPIAAPRHAAATPSPIFFVMASPLTSDRLSWNMGGGYALNQASRRGGVMAVRLHRIAALISAVAASVILAPAASADPALPQPGSENASATIGDLQALGYDVQINYDN